MEKSNQTQSAKATHYWMDLSEADPKTASLTPTKQEFAQPPQEALDKDRSGMDRRSFMKLMGASSVMASLAGCTRRPVQKIVPYVKKPEEITPGIPNYYASSCPSTGYGLVLTTREGRPIKVDGNDEHPLNSNGLSASGQASILDLYDPDRLEHPTIAGAKASWDQVVESLARDFKPQQTAVLSATSLSIGVSNVLKTLGVKTYMYDALPMDDIRKGQSQSFGRAVLPRYRFDKANVIVSIDADFLDTWLSPVEYAKLFTKGRDVESGSISKFYALESTMRLTGQNADERVAIHPEHRLYLALGLANEVGRLVGRSAERLAAYTVDRVAKRTNVDREILERMAKDLAQNRGKSLVVAGGCAGKVGEAVALQNVVNYINWILGNDGKTVDGTVSPSNTNRGSFKSLESLLMAIHSGSISTLVIHGINPAYLLPESFGFAKAMKAVANVVYVGQYQDETAKLANVVAAESHPFESWGDVNPAPSLFGVQQPTIRPLADTMSFSDLLIKWAKAVGRDPKVENSYELTRKIFRNLHQKSSTGKSFEDYWVDVLHNGYVDELKARRSLSSAGRSYQMGALSLAINEAIAARPSRTEGGNFTLVLQPSIALGDGSQANNPQLQELPDPITKITWDNYLAMSPKVADKLGLEDGDVVDVKNSAAQVKLPIYRQVGLLDDVLVANLGYGRKFEGRVGSGVGQSVSNFLKPFNGIMNYVANGVKITKTGEKIELASTQKQKSLEGRDIIFETTFDEWKKDPHSGIVHHLSKINSLWSKHKYEGYKWGMVVDMNKCTGCSSCVIACSVENNVPAVGYDQVKRGREMHWIRVDRYYSGSVENPNSTHQVMLCQHCDNAPCETVCPVIATSHSDEGLNQMTYNRCVGTRYCANNCPYKVRRFNFLEYNAGMNKEIEHPLSLSKNPEVTIRSRGIMEKCSFCSQRIEFARSTAKDEGRKIKDGEVRTACEQACPTNAITFGNTNDTNSRVAKGQKDPRAYNVLEELNAKPAIAYQTKVWNRKPSTHSGGGHAANSTQKGTV